MNPFLQSIFEKRDKPIGESSQKLYARNLFKLNDSKEVTDLNFLKDMKHVLGIIQDYKPTTQRSFIISACVVLKNSNEKLYQQYYELLTTMNNGLKVRTEKTHTQEDNWMSQSEIEDKLKPGVTELNSTTNIITGTIDSGSITGRTGTTITAPTITASGNLLYGTTNVATKISSIETSLNGKQSTLIAGNNITITNNTISSTGGTGGTDLNSTSNIITGTISCGNLTGRTSTIITAPTITASSNLLYGSAKTNVGTKISSIESSLNGKQPTLTSTSNITTGTISSGTITGRTGATITAPTITAGTNLLYGSTSVGTKIEQLETNITAKQDFINDNGLSISKTLDYKMR